MSQKKKKSNLGVETKIPKLRNKLNLQSLCFTKKSVIKKKTESSNVNGDRQPGPCSFLTSRRAERKLCGLPPAAVTPRVRPPMPRRWLLSLSHHGNWCREGAGLWAGPPGHLGLSSQKVKISTEEMPSSSFPLADSLPTFDAFTSYMK